MYKIFRVNNFLMCVAIRNFFYTENFPNYIIL